MGDSFKWNQGNLADVISGLKEKKQKLVDEQQRLLELKGKIGSIWRGNEYQKAEDKINQTANALAKAIEDVSQQIIYLEKKNNSFSEIRSGL